MENDKYKYALPVGHVLHGATREYVIEEVLGKGGFGITYKVKANVFVDNIPFKLHFAVKEYFPTMCWRDDSDNTTMSYPVTMQDEITDSLNDFVYEGIRLKQLCKLNTNIVNVNEVFEANGTAYYVMEYLEGGDLRKMVRDNGGYGVSEKQMLDVMIPIGQALQCLHDNKMLHLDIKPDNIVMRFSPKDNSHDPTLIDFGLATHFRSDGTPTTKAPSQGISPGYSPVDQYVPVKKFDPRLDVYAFSATCLYLLTGKDPVESFEMPKGYVKSLMPTTVSDKVVGIIERGMSKDKEQRIGSINEMLECFLTSQENIPEMVAAVPQNDNKTEQLEPPIVAATHESERVITEPTPDGSKGLKNEKSKKEHSEPKKSSSKKTYIALAAVAALALLAGLAIWGMKSCSNGEDNTASVIVSNENIGDSAGLTNDSVSADLTEIGEQIEQEQPSKDKIEQIEAGQNDLEDNGAVDEPPLSSNEDSPMSPMKVEQPKPNDTKTQKEKTVDNTALTANTTSNNTTPTAKTPSNNQKSDDMEKTTHKGVPSVSGLDGYTLAYFPTAPCPGPGTVVVQVKVDPRGTVTSATVVEGSLKNNKRACDICRGLAMRSTFRVPKNTNVERTGTITYKIK